MSKSEKDVRPLEIYQEVLSVMSREDCARHIVEMTHRFGSNAIALFTLLFDKVDFFKKPDDPQIVAARMIMYLKEGK